MQDNEWFAGSQDSDLGQIITRGRLFAKGQKQFDSFPMRIEIQRCWGKWHANRQRS